MSAARTVKTWELHLTPEAPTVVDPSLVVDGKVVLLGSTVRGILRHTALRLARAEGEVCSGETGCGCRVCRIFGTPDRPGTLQVRTSTAPLVDLREVTRVTIDRRLRTAARQKRLLATDTAAFAEHTVRVTAAGLDGEDEAFVEKLLGWVQLVGLRIGRRRSTGAGATRVEVRELSPQATAAPTSAAHPGPAGGEQTAGDQTAGEQTADGSHYRERAGGRQLRVVVVEALEPLRLAGRAQRAFLRESERAIPPNTLRGALGWALARAHGDDAARWLMVDEPIRVGPGWACDDGADDRDPTPWLGLHRCRGTAGHTVDLCEAKIRATLSGEPVEMRCPQCGSWLKPAGPASPRLVVLGQTAIDPRRNRAAEGQLRYQVAVAPGERFCALVEATDAQFDLLAGLGEILVGGNKGRGLGAASLRVGPAVRVDPFVAGYGFKDVDFAVPGGGTRRVAVAGFAADAHCREPLADVLARAGLEVVACEIRTVTRGGWDTEGRALRPIRRLVRAGSWIAVAKTAARGDEERAAAGPSQADGPSEILARLAEELFVPEETDPIWLVARPLRQSEDPRGEVT
ncbi:MAG: hypothetical protein KatS3mg008_1299 [Acidimicrobiales bacterium]|nr:MAG: hypothetical protein KatS3mg008_1299 [Acidimicrobiales bacterium]